MASNSREDTYTLRQLLDGEITLVIPDVQRSYCWGVSADEAASGAPDRVRRMVAGLVHLYHTARTVPMGIIHGYEESAGDKRIMVIDGQQRLTTFYLLAGMLFRRTSSGGLRRMLISDYKLVDDCTPRLLYQSRSEAMYFISDLVTHFFLNRDGRLSNLERSPWYYSGYHSDPTVRSIIGALRSIDSVLEDAAATAEFDFDDFSRYVADSVILIYHDLGSRATAESTFLTINTTSQPLSKWHNYKALLFGAEKSCTPNMPKNVADMERWALENRTAPGQPPSAALDNILYLWRRYCALQDTRTGGGAGMFDVFDPSRLGELNEFFRALARVADAVPATDTRSDTTIATTAYALRWPEATNVEVSRFAQWISNIERYRKFSPSGSDIVSAIEMIEAMDSPRIVSLAEVKNNAARIINAEEKEKLQLRRQLQAQGVDDDTAHNLIERLQAHPMLNGRISRVAHWCTSSEKVDIDKFKKYTDAIYALWGDDIECNPCLDLLRRALLTLRHKGYPIMRKSNTSLTMCWHDYDWQRLMQNSPGVVRMLIERYITSQHTTPGAFLENIVEKYADHSNPYFFLIKDANLVARCSRRSLMQPCAAFTGMRIQRDDAGASETKMWFIDQIPLKIDLSLWAPVRAYGLKCLYTDNLRVNAAIDLYSLKGGRLRVEYFERPAVDNGQKRDIDIDAVAGHAPVHMSYDSKRRRRYAVCDDARSALNLIRRLADLTNNY